jgi:hypothetical protein
MFAGWVASRQQERHRGQRQPRQAQRRKPPSILAGAKRGKPFLVEHVNAPITSTTRGFPQAEVLRSRYLVRAKVTSKVCCIEA